jgi:hypothetical protein
MSSDTTVDYTKFEVTKFEAPKPEENDRSMGQLVSYPSYNGGSLYLQLPWVKLFTYGIPRLGEYYKTDDDRAHLRVPLDLSVPEILDFVNKVKAIDAKFSSEEYKEKLFGKKAKKYTYSPIYREGQAPEEDSDEEDTKHSKPKAPRPPYLKLKFDLTWPDKKVKTTIFESIQNTSTNKRDRKKIDVSTIDEAANALRYMSTVRPIARCVKLWAHNDKKKDPQYGLTFKLIKVEVEPAPKMGNYVSSKDIQESSAFVDSDDEDNVFNITKSAKPVAPAPAALLDEESDEEAVVVQKKTVQVESDSDSDEEPVVVQKKTVQVESDSESDDEPKTPAPAPKKAAVKQAVVESDSDEEPVAKKPAPKKAAEKSKNKSK